jgi:ribose transport system permease protein
MSALETTPELEAAPTSAAELPRTRRSLGRKIAERYSGLFVWAVVIAIFAIYIPQTFLTTNNVRSIAGDQAITAILAIALLIPLAAGVFDLSFAGVMALSLCATLWAQQHGHGVLLSVLLGLAIGLVVGLVNGFVIVKLEVDSFIATLGMNSILTALAFWLTGGQQIVTGISPDFVEAGNRQVFALPVYFFLMLLVAAVCTVVLEKTPVGRYIYACGGNLNSARLAGVRTERIIVGSLVASGFLAGFAGVVLAAKLGTGDYTVGAPYLLPAFCAVFLGSTQIRPGRVNVLGTLIAIYLLATGIKGLQLAGAQPYVNDLFNGLALIVAVALSARAGKLSRGSRV